MSAHSVAVSSAAVPSAVPNAVPSAVPSAAIDAYVEQELRRLRIPGATVAVVEGDRIVHLRGFGRARPGGETPSAQTPFVLGSTTKSFTALAVMQGVEAGRVALDAPVRRYLPWFRTADAARSDGVTVRQLLHQTSGLPGGAGMRVLADLDQGPDAAARQCRGLASVRLNHEPGTAFEYSNLNYMLLGLVIEATSGLSYGAYIERHIFAPLGMRHSYVTQAEARQAGLAVGHRYWFGYPVAAPELPLPCGALAAGMVISCAEDMARYLMAHLNGGSLNGGRGAGVQVLSPAGMAELHRGAVEASEFGIAYGRYGMGWVVSRVGAAEVLWHGGNVADFSSFMAILPESGRGVVLLINSDHYGLPPVLAEVGMGLAALLAGQAPAQSMLCAMPWAMRGLALVPLCQAAGVLATVRLLRRARRGEGPGIRPWQVWLPLLVNLPLALAPLLVRRARMQGYLRLYMPDLAWIVRCCGAFAAAWALVRTGLLLGSRKGVHP